MKSMRFMAAMISSGVILHIATVAYAQQAGMVVVAGHVIIFRESVPLCDNPLLFCRISYTPAQLRPGEGDG